MASFEALYGKNCKSHICWWKVNEQQMIGLDSVQVDVAKVNIIREKLRVVQSR